MPLGLGKYVLVLLEDFAAYEDIDTLILTITTCFNCIAYVNHLIG